MLRDKNAVGRADKWRKLDEAGRRKFLQTEIASLHDYEAVDVDPAALDVAEYYATPLDLAHAFDWIRRHTGPNDAGRPLLQVMGTELKFDRKTWPKNGKWYTFHAYFNTDKGKLKRDEMIAVVYKMLATIEAALK
jgi:hypothetical protein